MKRDTRFFNLPPWWILSNILLHFMNMLKCILQMLILLLYWIIQNSTLLHFINFYCIRMDSWLWLASYLQQSTLMFKQKVAHALRSFQRKDGRSRKPHNWVTWCRWQVQCLPSWESHVLPSSDDMHKMLWRPGLWALTANWRKGRRERANKRQKQWKLNGTHFVCAYCKKWGGNYDMHGEK